MTQWGKLGGVLGGLLATCWGAYADDSDYKVYTEAPRLFLTARRLRMLQRETQRQSLRWVPFEALMLGKARMPEPGFASALYGKVKGDAAACREAMVWAAGASAAKPAELRQMALAYDWCGAAVSAVESQRLAARMKPALDGASMELTALRSRVLAAVALAEVEPAKSQAVLKQVVEGWWRGTMAPVWKSRRFPFTRREEVFALLELMHAIRDNLNLDLRDDMGRSFEALPPYLILNYYPAPWPAPENQYRVPVYSGAGDPDLREAALARAADLALVAFDTNAPASQFLQGWLILDRFLMRGVFGLPYEFLWANPYQPGLSYYHMPDVFHDGGRLFIRSSWEEEAVWFGYAEGKAQLFQNGARQTVNLNANLAPLELGEVRLVFWKPQMKFEAKPVNFLLGLEPEKVYDIEIDDEEMFDAKADSAGILELRLAPGQVAGARLRRAASVN